MSAQATPTDRRREMKDLVCGVTSRHMATAGSSSLRLSMCVQGTEEATVVLAKGDPPRLLMPMVETEGK